VTAVIFLPAVPAERKLLSIAGDVLLSSTAIKSPVENGCASPVACI